MCIDNVVCECKQTTEVPPTVATVMRVVNGYVISIGKNDYIAKTEYDIAGIITKHFPLEEL